MSIRPQPSYITLVDIVICRFRLQNVQKRDCRRFSRRDHISVSVQYYTGKLYSPLLDGIALSKRSFQSLSSIIIIIYIIYSMHRTRHRSILSFAIVIIVKFYFIENRVVLSIRIINNINNTPNCR